MTTTQQGHVETNREDLFAQWTDLMKTHVARLEGALEQAHNQQELIRSQVDSAVDELARLMKGSIALQAEMAEQWLALARGASQKATDLMNTWRER